MVQRRICPSLGSIRRSLAIDATVISRCSSRTFSNSFRRMEEQPVGSTPAPSTQGNPISRRTRSEIAMKQITSLKNRRAIQPGGLAKGVFPSGQIAQRRPPRNTNPDASGAPQSPGPQAVADGSTTPKPRLAKFAGRPTTTRGSGSPPGQMVRAPRMLNRSPSATADGVRGPNLGGRQGGARGGARGGAGGRERKPSRRDRKPKDQDTKRSTSLRDIEPASRLSDGMVQHLLRLQRKEWDRTPYEPIYSNGSLAAQQLIHEGRELFRGESPPVKFYGGLEKRIGVAGMFGAETHLKIRRVPDGDAAPFGQEDVIEIGESQNALPSSTKPAAS